MTNYLITKQQINSIAFITPISVVAFKDVVILSVQESDVQNALGSELYNQVIIPGDELSYNPAFTDLVTKYIQPFMAFKIKSITLALTLAESADTIEAFNMLKESVYTAKATADSYYATLLSYVSSFYSAVSSEKPSLISGFLV
ncbi:MAG: hypothetical protein H8E98_04880 [Bacteroidetes bacterium]|nr:hypothetical protein [Bacteroidota bacterium]